MTRPSIICEAALMQSDLELDRTARIHGMDVAIETAKGRMASNVKFLRRNTSPREAYEVLQELTDAAARPLIESRGGGA